MYIIIRIVNNILIYLIIFFVNLCANSQLLLQLFNIGLFTLYVVMCRSDARYIVLFNKFNIYKLYRL